jgi:hypothetical protein
MKNRINKLLFFIFSTFFLLSSFSYGQGQACDNMKKLDELIKTENRNTDKYLAIESARFYWWRRCQCESGKVVDQGGEKAIIEYLATGYDNSQWAKGKYSDIPIPNKRDFKTGDCFSTHEFKKTVDHTDCQSINYSTQEDPQRYITQYMIYRCMCEKGVNSESESKQLVAFMDLNYKNANSYYTGKSLNLPNPLKKCSVVNFKNSGAKNKINNKTSTQIEMEQRLVNYNKAMSLKKQGENIAKAYAQQVKSYSELNRTNSPEALLDNFNSNMQAIAELEAQNKEDNLNQLSNTLNSSLNDLNSGNYEGAMFSTLSLLDQAEAKREARRQAEMTRGRLAYQTKQKMTAFYTKAVELNDDAINQYYEKAAYAFSKDEESYLLEYVANLECHKEFIEKNFSYNSSSWLKNTCSIPGKKSYVVNNLVAKDIQYINTAKRKYDLYIKTGEQVFQKGAMRFAGLAATENPKPEYYYLMGHYAGVNNPLVAYSSFLTAKSKNSKYFSGDKASEYALIKLSLESSFKKAIEENDQEVVTNIVGAGLHQTIKIDNSLPIIYAIKIDQADVVYAFLNTDLVGKPQSVINTKIQSTLFMAALLDAPNTIQKFVDLGFSIDFSIDEKTLLDAAEEVVAINSFNKISNLIGGQRKYTFTNSDVVKLRDLLEYADENDTIKAINIFHLLKSQKARYKTLDLLLEAKNKDCFFYIYENNKNFSTNWAQENRDIIFKQFCEEVFDRENRHIYRYLSTGLIYLPNGIALTDNDLYMFLEVWWKQTWSYHKTPMTEREELGLVVKFIEYSAPILDINAPWGETATLEYIISSPKYYQMNLLDFAIYERQDSKMVRVLLENNTNDTNISIDLEKVVQYPMIFSPKRIRGVPIKQELYSEMMQNGYEILNMLIFDFNYNKDAFKLLANRKFDRSLDRSNLAASNYLKSLIDKLIETDQGDINWNKDWDSAWFKQTKKRVKNWEDRQYWNAILDGDFDKRY